jgi:hypothetical protein
MSDMHGLAPARSDALVRTQHLHRVRSDALQVLGETRDMPNVPLCRQDFHPRFMIVAMVGVRGGESSCRCLFSRLTSAGTICSSGRHAPRSFSRSLDNICPVSVHASFEPAATTACQFLSAPPPVHILKSIRACLGRDFACTRMSTWCWTRVSAWWKF